MLSMICLQFREQKRLFSAEGMTAVNKSAEDGGPFSSKVIRSVFIILLLDLLGFTLILPLLPSILDHYAQTGVSCFLFVCTVYVKLSEIY